MIFGILVHSEKGKTCISVIARAENTVGTPTDKVCGVSMQSTTA